MTPTHAAKNGKRYRYYISNSLIAGANKSRASEPGDGLPIAAQEIERHVITAIGLFLADRQRVAIELCPDDAAPAVVTAALRQLQR